jgi:hypothetical protein
MKRSGGAFQVKNGRAGRRDQIGGPVNYSEFFLTIITAGGGGAVVAFMAFRYFATSWLESKFEQRLEAYRHENAIELQKLRANIDGALNRTVKAQEKEFDVLSETWRLANVAQGTMESFSNPFQSYADLGKMSEDKKRVS